MNGRHRILGGWRDVLDDIRALCRALEELPGVCACGHGPAHFEDGCPCCGHTETTFVPACGECDEQLARLRTPIDQMTVDTYRFFPFIKEFVARHDAAAAERVREIQAHIAALCHSFDRLVVAEGQFRSECRSEHISVLKEAAAALRRNAEALNRVL